MVSAAVGEIWNSVEPQLIEAFVCAYAEGLVGYPPVVVYMLAI
jgi:hypothetical protein